MVALCWYGLQVGVWVWYVGHALSAVVLFRFKFTENRSWRCGVRVRCVCAVCSEGRGGGGAGMGGECGDEIFRFGGSCVEYFRKCQTHENDSKSLMYEFIAWMKQPKYIFFAGSVQVRDPFFVLRRRSCE